jgi:hypothetical protein
MVFGYAGALREQFLVKSMTDLEIDEAIRPLAARQVAGDQMDEHVLIRWTSTGPIPVWIMRSGPWPCRTSRSRPSASFRSLLAAIEAATSASMACSNNWRAPDRRRAVRGSSISSGWRKWIMLVSSFMA